MARREIPLDSDALRANIAGTAQDVDIPTRYLPLLVSVDDLYGVREPLREMLAEYFHAYRNVDVVIEGLQTVLLRNWSYLERNDERVAVFSLLTDLVTGLFEEELTDAQTSQLLRQVLLWSGSAASGRHGEEYLDSLLRLARCLERVLARQPSPFLERDTLLRGLAQKSAGLPHFQAAVGEVLRDTLRLGYRRAIERLDVAAWAAGDESQLNRPQEVAALFGSVGGERIGELAASVSRVPVPVLLSGEYPTFSMIVSEILRILLRVQTLEDRFAVCLFLLKDDTLGYRQHEVMVDLLAAVKALLEPARHMDFERLLGRLTRFFHVRERLFPEMRLQIYQAVGVAIGEAGATRAADRLVEDLLSWPFEQPDIRGATDEWRTLVNPYHLPNLRCWLAIIESNPLLYETLVAALWVQLRLGGVFVADTDLFQRDVTQLLNADILPVYQVVKQLLRALPVYFNEVGAEGELRTVSTEIDEICGRQDTLMHFLRKQTHAESSNRLLDFTRAVLQYWSSLDPAPLEAFLSEATMAAVREERIWAEGPHSVLESLRSQGDGSVLDALVSLSPVELERHLAQQDGACPIERRRLALVLRLHQLLCEKYSVRTGDLAAAVEHHLHLTAETRRRFATALESWQRDPNRREELLDATLGVLEELKSIILSSATSEGQENIYHKRHIAAGIPSMYGNYTEPKFDALGLTFRVEVLLRRLLDDVVASTSPCMTRTTLREMDRAFRLFERTLAVDGLYSRTLTTNICLLDGGLRRSGLTFRQYQNILQFLAQSVSELARVTSLTYDIPLRAILEQDPRPTERAGLDADAIAEIVLRDLLVSAVGLQTLDHYIGSSLRLITSLSEELGGDTLTRMMHYDSSRLVSWIHEMTPDIDDQITVGYKALGLKRLARYGHRVPEGFVLSTQLFTAVPAMDHQPFYEAVVAQVREAVEHLQEQTGLRLGDPEALLTLSIRSGAAVSMPGLMLTFTNVGLNDELTEALGRRLAVAWRAWDSYRRFLQSWAMAEGVERDVFDAIMAEFKERFGVRHKVDFTAEQMREIALSYKSQAGALGVRFLDDPFGQVMSCIRKVLVSWDSPQARAYRAYTGTAEEWGTAVIVQRMVFGNLGPQSGAGVTFTRNPLERHGRRVRLFGDFTTSSQGEDLVGGLVYPLPISEAQRRGSPAYRGVEQSLERDFPEIYAKLLEVAEDLVTRRNYDAQEIEFTFESPDPEDLFLLQKRPMIQTPTDDLPVFEPTWKSEGEAERDGCLLPVAFGMGVSGGAYSGRVAVTAEQITVLLGEGLEENVILLRPDTVPEDLPMIVQVQGILTARGGATSHAAITAKRLGKTAVVDCRTLEVDDKRGTARIAGRELRAGDWLSIDGRTGNIYLGWLKTIRPPAGSFA